MRWKKSVTGLPIFAILLLPSVTVAQVNAWHGTISVDVEADSEEDAGIIKSYITRELRSLRDVSIVSSDEANNNLSVVVIQTKVVTSTSYGIPTGYALSAVLTNKESARAAIMISSDPALKSRQEALLKNNVLMLLHVLRISNKQGLRKTCSELVTEIDATSFELDRKAYQDAEASIREKVKPQ